MTIVSRPSSVPSLLGGSIELPVRACGHEPSIEVSPCPLDTRVRAECTCPISAGKSAVGTELLLT